MSAKIKPAKGKECLPAKISRYTVYLYMHVNVRSYNQWRIGSFNLPRLCVVILSIVSFNIKLKVFNTDVNLL